MNFDELDRQKAQIDGALERLQRSPLLPFAKLTTADVATQRAQLAKDDGQGVRFVLAQLEARGLKLGQGVCSRTW